MDAAAIFAVDGSSGQMMTFLYFGFNDEDMSTVQMNYMLYLQL
jgi:hypothetical protein